LIGERDITRFAALWAIIQTIDAKTDITLTFADGAILFAGAVLFAFVALRTNDLLAIGCHPASEKDFT
jgi:hypothetical protein